MGMLGPLGPAIHHLHGAVPSSGPRRQTLEILVSRPANDRFSHGGAPFRSVAGFAAVATTAVVVRRTLQHTRRRQARWRGLGSRHTAISALPLVATNGGYAAVGAGATVNPSAVVERLYHNFNSCDADGTANCFTEDVVYEDLLLGNSTIVNSRDEFRELISTHPVFVGNQFCKSLNLPPPDLKVKVDSIAEDAVRNTVGVEWHVEVNGEPLLLGRGLSFMRICPRTGLIQRAVDIAEAPWRAIGLLLAPFARGLRDFSRLLRYSGVLLMIIPLAFLGIFLDRSSLDSIRTEIDSLDDFRDGLDVTAFMVVRDALVDLGLL